MLFEDDFLWTFKEENALNSRFVLTFRSSIYAPATINIYES